MGLQVNAQGTREGIMKAFDAAAAKPSVATDQKQVDAVRALLAAEVAAMPESVNGVRVCIEATAHAGARVVQVTILPMALHL